MHKIFVLSGKKRWFENELKKIIIQNSPHRAPARVIAEKILAWMERENENKEGG